MAAHRCTGMEIPFGLLQTASTAAYKGIRALIGDEILQAASAAAHELTIAQIGGKRTPFLCFPFFLPENRQHGGTRSLAHPDLLGTPSSRPHGGTHNTWYWTAQSVPINRLRGGTRKVVNEPSWFKSTPTSRPHGGKQINFALFFEQRLTRSPFV